MNESALASPPVDESLVALATDEFMDALRRGETPRVEDFAERYPSIGPVLRQVLGALVLLRSDDEDSSADHVAASGSTIGPADPLGDFRILREIGRGGMGVVYEAEQLSLGRRVALKVLPFAAAMDPRHLQRFKTEAQAAAALQHQNIVPVYAVGCERGVHFYAMQYIDGHPLSAVIAELRTNLKFDDAGGESPASHPVETPSALAATMLQASFGSAGDGNQEETDDAVAADTAKPRAGVSTDASIRSREYFRSVAQLGIQAADGLELAHGFGIVHRDIKPGNLLLDGRGNLWIADFGLAQVQSDSRLTMSGDILGTLRYMSPEQALRQPGLVDHRTDVYSLGVTLYELLTLESAFGGEDRRQLLRQIAFDEPVAPRKRNPAVPHDLETIVLKSLAKSPTERYGSAKDLREDLQRYLNDEPIRARRPTVLQRAKKWAVRHRGIVWTGLASLLLLLAVSSAVLAFSNREINAALEDRTAALAQERLALDERTTALNAETKAKQALGKALGDLQAEEKRKLWEQYLQQLLLADLKWRNNDIAEANRLLDETPPEFRDWEWHFLKRRCRVEVYNSPAGSLKYRATGLISPDGRFGFAGSNGDYRIWRIKHGKVVHELKIDGWTGRTVKGKAFSPDGKQLAVIHANQLDILEVESGNLKLTLKLGTGTKPKPTYSRKATFRGGQPAFSPDGRLLALAEIMGKLRIWDLSTKKEKTPLNLGNARVGMVVFSPDGKWLAMLKQIPVRSGIMPLVEIRETESWGVRYRFSAEGAFPVRARGRSAVTSPIAFSPDCRQLAYSLGDNTVRLRHLSSPGAPMTILSGHSDVIRSLAYSPDGELLATAGDTTVRLWDTQRGRELHAYRGHDSVVEQLAFTSDGTSIVSASAMSKFYVWSVNTANNYNPLAIPTDASSIQQIAFLPGRNSIVTTQYDGRPTKRTLRIRPVDNWAEKNAAKRIPFPNITFSMAGGSAIAASAGNAVWLYDPGTLAVVERFAVPLKVIRGRLQGNFSVAGCPDGKLFALAVGERELVKRRLYFRTTLYIYDRTTKQRWKIDTVDGFYPSNARFAPDGRTVAVAGRMSQADPAVRISRVMVFDTLTGRRVANLPGPEGGMHPLAFSPDGRYLAAAGGYTSRADINGFLYLWELASGRIVLKLRAEHTFSGVGFTRSGRRLITVGGGSLRIIDVASKRDVLRLDSHGRSARLAVSADGHRIATAGSDSTIRIWDGRPLKAAKR